MKLAILIAGLAVATSLLVWSALEASEDAESSPEAAGKIAKIRIGCWSFGSTGARVLLCRELPRG